MPERNDSQAGGSRRILKELKAARREQRGARQAWLEQAYRAGEEPLTPGHPYRFALVAALKGERGGEMPLETLKRAQSYLAAMRRCTEARKAVRMEFGI